MKVLALDLSLTATGVACPAGTLLTLSPRPNTLTGPARLDWIETNIVDLVTATEPDLVAIEGYAFGRPNQATHIGELGGVVRLALWRLGYPYAEIPPASVKLYATGRGVATKADMRVALLQRTGIDERDDNRIDAWWLRAMTLDHFGEPIVTVPTSHRRGLARITWPEMRTT